MTVAAPTDFLTVQGNKITRNGAEIILKGAAVGGWMNMENFITGYPGHEHQVRAALKRVLGEEKYEYFFDKFLEYFFTEEDAKFYASLGFNALRIPVNYRHFEDDLNPRVFKKEGLKHLDRVVDLCAKHGIYSIIDLHAAPGGQNNDWHCDSGIAEPMLWVHKDFQDRTVAIWEHLATHYKDNTWVAGYNPLNEPTDAENTRVTAFYAVLEQAIRRVDPHHILFWDGNTYGSDFRYFKDPLPNSVYACHDYSVYGFPAAPEPFTGSPEQIEHHENAFTKKVDYMRKHNLPIWNGEFGPVYENKDTTPDFEKVNEQRYNVLKCQLEIYARDRASWSIWLYKDIGLQGLVHVGRDTPYMKLLAPWLAKKRSLAADAWGNDDTPVRPVFDPLDKWITDATNGAINKRYPRVWRANRHLSRYVREMLLSDVLTDEFASYFADKSLEELDALAGSFKFENCVQRDTLTEILRHDAERARAGA